MKKAPRDANTARALAEVKGAETAHPLSQTHGQDRLQTAPQLASTQCNYSLIANA